MQNNAKWLQWRREGRQRRCQYRKPQHDTSMVWLICPMASLLSEWVQARGRAPSTELALVREAVRERARRVMLAEGTGDSETEKEKEEGVEREH